jgi:hypothetical protein
MPRVNVWSFALMRAANVPQKRVAVILSASEGSHQKRQNITQMT